MKLTIEIPEEELIEKVKEAIESHIVRELAKSWLNPDKREMRDAYKAAVKDIIKDKEEALIERIIENGSELLVRKGMKKMLDNIKEKI